MNINAGLITCCLPCVTFGQIAEIVDEGRSCKINERRNKQNIIIAILLCYIDHNLV